METRWSAVGQVALAAAVGAIVALGADRGVQRLTALPTPISAPSATPLDTPTAFLIQLAPAVPTPAPTLMPPDLQAQQVNRLQQQVREQRGWLHILSAQQHIVLAGDALHMNDLLRANQELVAAHAALDRAYQFLSEDLKQVLDNERREVGRVRADLVVAPEGLGDRLHTLQDQLLALASS
ncbi:MAG: hypothetical protein NVSMB42_10020 [Herpetosiphon sp.]